MRVEDHGTVVLLMPETDIERMWIDENLIDVEPWQWQGTNLVVDHRMAHDIVAGMREAGILPANSNAPPS